MWPFSTIRDLRLEIESAEHANKTLRKTLDDVLTSRDVLGRQIAHVRSDLLARDNEIRELNGKLVIGEHAVQAKNADIRQLGAQIAGLTSQSKSLAAERDEAVLRARQVDKHWAQCQNKLTEAHEQLRGALVRDPKTGRMTKWAEPASTRTPIDALTTDGFMTDAKGDRWTV